MPFLCYNGWVAGCRFRAVCNRLAQHPLSFERSLQLAMKEFLGIGGYTREPEGYLSPEHLIFTSCLVLLTLALAILLGLRNKGADARKKQLPLICAAVLMDAVEIFKIIVMIYRSDDPSTAWHNLLPLFLCSIQLITIPLAAFAKGRLQEAALDFVLIFGMLGGVLGTIGAGQNYNAYPVLSLDNVASGLTHCISAFASLYIGLSGLASMKKRNVWITFTILGCFCIAAFAANMTLGTNYMFLKAGDGTPYDILYNLLGCNPILYPIGVITLFLIYIITFYGMLFWIRRKKSKNS